MKKLLLVLSATVVLLSCSKDDVTQEASTDRYDFTETQEARFSDLQTAKTSYRAHLDGLLEVSKDTGKPFGSISSIETKYGDYTPGVNELKNRNISELKGRNIFIDLFGSDLQKEVEAIKDQIRTADDSDHIDSYLNDKMAEVIKNDQWSTEESNTLLNYLTVTNSVQEFLSDNEDHFRAEINNGGQFQDVSNWYPGKYLLTAVNAFFTGVYNVLGSILGYQTIKPCIESGTCLSNNIDVRPWVDDFVKCGTNIISTGLVSGSDACLVVNQSTKDFTQELLGYPPLSIAAGAASCLLAHCFVAPAGLIYGATECFNPNLYEKR